MFEQALSLIGTPLNHPNMQAFLAEHGFKPAKKTEISGKSSEPSFWLEHKKLGINLSFTIDTNNPLYPPMAGSKKGLWLPILHYVTFLSTNIAYPLGLKMYLSIAQVTQILGDFSYKSSDIHKMWLNDDGSESFYGWRKTIDESKQIELHARIQTDGKLDELNAYVIELNTIFQLFNPLLGENLSHFLADVNHLNPASIFIEWAIKHDLYLGQATEQAGVAKVKNGLNIIDFFQQHVKANGIYLEFFAPVHQQFIRQYINNMSSHDVYFGGDYLLSFLTKQAERDNYFGEAAMDTLAKLRLNEANKAKIFALLDARFTEFKAHGFAKSVKDLKP